MTGFATGPACSAPPWPDRPWPVCPRRAHAFEPWRAAGYGKAMPQRAFRREALLRQENDQRRARRRLREHQLFGRTTETSAATAPTPTPPASDGPPRRPRGQQRGRPGPRRRHHAHLPAVCEEHELPAAQCRGQRCGRPFATRGGTEDSTILEAEVRAHRRVIRRHRYRPTCDGGAHPGVVTAPAAPRGARVAPGAAEGAGELGQPRDRLDGGRRAPRGADGPPRGGAGAAWPGGGPEERRRQRRGVGGSVGRDAVLVGADVVLGAAESAGVVDGVAPGAVERFWPGNRSEEGRRRWSLADAKAGEDTS